MCRDSISANDGSRRLVLIDIENHCGKPVLEPEDVSVARSEIERLSASSSDDLFIVGTSHTHNFLSAKYAWPGAEHVFRWGHNGADVALIEAARRHARNLHTFCEVLMLSGDGIFTTLVREFSGRGVSTTVASFPDRLSGSLAAAASRLRLMEASPATALAC